MTKTIIIWTIVIIGSMANGFVLIIGIRRNKMHRVPFRIRQLFKPKTTAEKSGTELIVESLLFFFGVAIWYIFWGLE